MNLKPAIFFAIIAILLETPFVNAQDVQTGSFRITSTSEQILGKETALNFKKQIDIDEEITWSVYVPKNYDPTNPPGILLYQTYLSYSGVRRGNIQDPTGWKSAMDERNMILIRIISKGNEYPLRRELFIGVLSPMVLQQKYKINSNRVYTSADNVCNSAGAITQNYPNIIKGAIYINCNPSIWHKKEPELIDLMRQNRYYFIAGRDRVDQIDNRQEIRKYKGAGIKDVTFVRTSRLSRTENLNRTQLIAAIDYLDGNEPAEK